MTSFQNRLINETSPYLLQHAHNPVDWFPWGDEALTKAKKENKLILISVGYSACHWCHVMERESFEKEEVAEIMNRHFVCIKVDREERPDVDQIYMNAVHLMRGQGGWPLNCFAMPDGRPVFGGTYFPKNQWMHTLKTLHQSFLDDPQKFEEYAQNLANGIAQSDVIQQKVDEALYSEKDLSEIADNISKSFDMTEGGFGGAPKFPFPVGLEFMMAFGQLKEDSLTSQFVELTLDKMAAGGIYDQIGGGFARYSVDKVWLVPHFEKMLYDNAQLISIYAQAYQINPKPTYKNVIEQSLEFVDRELSSSEGGFFSALDADSEGVEGKYYVWSKTEIDKVLGDKAGLFSDAFDISEEGNWENSNIPRRKDSADQLSQKYRLTKQELEEELSQLKQKLLVYRQNRIRPGLDDKILTSWNAMMIKAFADAYAVFGNDFYLVKAEKSAEFLWTKLGNGSGKLLRTYKNGTAKINAFLDDYAFLIKAFIRLYQLTFNKTYLDRAIILLDYTMSNFLETNSSMFFYTEKDESLISRKMELSDNVIPAANSVMAHNILDLGMICSNEQWVSMSRSMLINMQSQLKKGQIYYSNWNLLLLRFQRPAKEVVIMGERSVEYAKKLLKKWVFNTVFMGSTEKSYLEAMDNRYVEGKTLIYVCENKACQWPVEIPEKALVLI